VIFEWLLAGRKKEGKIERKEAKDRKVGRRKKERKKERNTARKQDGKMGKSISCT